MPHAGVEHDLEVVALRDREGEYPLVVRLAFEQLLAGNSFSNWIRVLRQSSGVEPKYWHRAAFVTLTSLSTTPLRACEWALFARRVRATAIRKPPVFVIGHWRCGTTLLHNLLCSDPAFGHINLVQMAAPESYLTAGPLFKVILTRLVKPARPMDNVPFTHDSPQEDEFVAVKMSPYSFYHAWSFPKDSRAYFDKYVLFRDVPDTVVAACKQTCLDIVKKTTLASGGKQLVMKNPVNTARIPMLLDLFPDAKFIHIVRNPHAVFPSTKNLHARTLSLFQMQSIGPDEIEENVFRVYRDLMQAYLKHRDKVPAGHLAEVRFEDLEQNPLAELRRLYAELDLPGYEDAEAAFSAHIESQAGYRKNRYPVDVDAIRKVEEHWGFALREWGYPRPSSNGEG